MDALAALGPLGLFVAAFLGATLLPLSSEVALAGALAGGVDVVPALVAASLGNGLACGMNYVLGRWSRAKADGRLERSRSGRAALRALERWGAWSLLFTWLPLVGDPLSVAAGAARVHPALFAAVVLPLRVGRYVAIAGLM